MLDKLLNPFGVRITETSKLGVWIGVGTSFALHLGFYVTLVHFICKAW